MANKLVFREISSEADVVDYLIAAINKKLERGQKVLWLVSGGSAIKVAIAVSRRLGGSPNLNNLTVSLVDERWGTPGHKDSNWQHLIAAGFKLEGATLKPILNGENLALTTKSFNNWLKGALVHHDYRLALLGIGADGHTAGILPNSPAVSATSLVAAYKGPDYVRITATAKALKSLDEAVIYAFGKTKHMQLDRLLQDIPIAEQPSQLIKLIRRAVVFSDYKP